MTIRVAKGGYDNPSDFVNRTAKALSNKNGQLFLSDAGDVNPDNPALKWFHSELAACEHKPTILEIGSGYGRWATALNGLYSSYVGVDITPERVAYAKANHESDIAKFHCIDSNWSLGSTFDVIITINVIQHLTLPVATELVKKIEEHLIPGTGRALLYEAQLGWYSEKEAEEMYAQSNCPVHMIPKPIPLINSETPNLTWSDKGNLRYVVTKQ